MIRLHNTLTRQKEELIPLDPKNVRMYVCGPTVYDYAHIGNARPAIVFDVLYRLLRHTYGADHVTYVRNITDIDDKINARAAEIAAAKGVSVEEARVEVTNRTAKQYLDDVAALGCLTPNHTPRATEYVDGMIAMIGTLIESGHAYAAEGHVLYDVSSKPDYGKLSRRSLDEMMAGARVEVAPYKKNPMDFVLWKPSDDLTPGWQSPWGRGRPGWHIECSVMGGALLGDTFDIHGGGVDLMFPHHENEIAQSEGCHHGAPLANIWMHNGFLQVEGEKMSKSLGNFITIRELLEQYPGDVLKFVMLNTHYRSAIDWTLARANDARRELHDWAKLIARSGIQWWNSDDVVPDDRAFFSALEDDLNTPLAIARLRELFRSNSKVDQELFVRLTKFLGFQRFDRPGFFEHVMISPAETVTDPNEDLFEKGRKRFFLARSYLAATANKLYHLATQYEEELKLLGYTISLSDAGELTIGLGQNPREELERYVAGRIAARAAARKAKDFKESDRIRDELLAKGIVLKDGPTGTTWEVKR